MSKTKTVITNKAHELAKEQFGYENAKDLMESVSENLKSSNDVIRNSAIQRAAEFTEKLTLLILYQEISNDGGLNSKYDWINTFNDGVISQGNSKQYVFQIPTGNENYESDEFNPTKKSLPQNDVHYISIYERDAQGKDVLTKGAYQFKKPLTIQQNEWLPYFKDGNLSTYISNLISYIRECYKMFVVDALHKLISTLTPEKVIENNDTDADTNNLFTAMVNDIIPIIEDFKYYNVDYNYDTKRGGAYCCDTNDIIIFSHHSIKQKLQSGVMSRMFHNQMITPTSYINETNWIGLNRNLVVPQDSNKAITTGQQVLDENTLYIFDKRLIKHLIQVESMGNQSYINNMTVQHTLHIWGVIDIVPWFKCVKYVNPNLTKQPN